MHSRMGRGEGLYRCRLFLEILLCTGLLKLHSVEYEGPLIHIFFGNQFLLVKWNVKKTTCHSHIYSFFLISALKKCSEVFLWGPEFQFLCMFGCTSVSRWIENLQSRTSRLWNIAHLSTEKVHESKNVNVYTTCRRTTRHGWPYFAAMPHFHIFIFECTTTPETYHDSNPCAVCRDFCNTRSCMKKGYCCIHFILPHSLSIWRSWVCHSFHF